MQAVYMGFSIFLVGWIMQTTVIFGIPYSPSYWTSTVIGTVRGLMPTCWAVRAGEQSRCSDP
jgi:hypothetical protein